MLGAIAPNVFISGRKIYRGQLFLLVTHSHGRARWIAAQALALSLKQLAPHADSAL